MGVTSKPMSFEDMEDEAPVVVEQTAATEEETEGEDFVYVEEGVDEEAVTEE